MTAPGSTRRRWIGVWAAVLLGGTAALLVMRQRLPEHAPPAAARPLVVDGLSIYAIDEGPATSDHTVVLLHGTPGSIDDWGALRAALSQRRRHRVVTPERAGMGWSESPASSAEHALGPHAERTFQALSRLGVRDPIIIGHSYGGAVALQLAADHPTFPAAVVHLCGVGPDLIGSAPWHRHALLVRAGLVLEVPVLGHVMSGWIIPAFLGVVDPTLWMRGQFAGDWDDVPAAYIDRHVRGLQMPRQLRNARREAAWLPADLDALAGRLSSVRAPVVVVSCEDDNMVPVSVGDALVAELPRTTRVVLPQAGHNVHVSRPDDVVDIVEQAILLADAPDTD